MPVEEVRERLAVGLCAWTDAALDLVENVNREKMEAMARADDSGDDGVSIYWDG